MEDIWKKLNKQYSNYKEIGSGGFALVYQARDRKSEEEVALKLIYLKDKHSMDSFINETEIHERLDHPHIVPLFDKQIFTSNKDDKVGVMIMKKMEMDLLTFVSSKSRLKSNTMKMIFRKILIAVKYLHEKGIAHLDLKPENILLQFQFKFGKRKISEVKICDFGFAKNWDIKTNRSSLIKLNNFNKRIGTNEYRAPEIETSQSVISLEKADIWSLGVTLFTGVTGYFPFSGSERNSRFISWIVIKEALKNDEQCFNLISKMLNDDFFDRPSVDEILSHPWLLD